MRYTEETYIDVPEEYSNLKQVVLSEINDYYVLLEDGRIWSKLAGRFMKTYSDNRITNAIVLRTKTGQFDTTISYLMRKHFGHDETFGGIQFRPVLGYEDSYVALEDGRIYSLRQYRFLKPSITQTGWQTVCLLTVDKKRMSAFPARLVWEAFNGPLKVQEKLVFKDGNKNNCRLDNLTTAIKGKYIVKG